jgi:hypothetical protein
MDEWLDWCRERLGTLVLVALVGLGFGSWWQGRALAQPAGVLAPEEPRQSEPASRAPWSRKKHLITPLADFELRARVLGRERYRFDRAAEISPLDLALGWGPMSNTRVLEALSISQRDRWFFWSANRLPLPPGEINSHAANMHMIPATKAVEARLLAVRPGQLVELRGQLVKVDGQDGWHWLSSLSRTDTGDGSCEVVWVDSITTADE